MANGPFPSPQLLNRTLIRSGLVSQAIPCYLNQPSSCQQFSERGSLPAQSSSSALKSTCAFFCSLCIVSTKEVLFWKDPQSKGKSLDHLNKPLKGIFFKKVNLEIETINVIVSHSPPLNPFNSIKDDCPTDLLCLWLRSALKGPLMWLRSLW